MEEFVRKLALWHTKTFKPIITHEELEPIMATLGFVPLPATCGWKEYVSAGGRNPTISEPLPRIRLPFPRIDGLHVLTYRAFFDAVSFYLVQRDISDHFHVRDCAAARMASMLLQNYGIAIASAIPSEGDLNRGMPLHRGHDLTFEKKFRRMNDEEGLYVYRDGTLDQAIAVAYSNTSHNSTSNSNNSSPNSNNGSSNSAGNVGLFVHLKDIIV